PGCLISRRGNGLVPRDRSDARESRMKIGIAGVGRMGGAMAERLMEQGFEVLVWNRTPARIEPLVGKGATACPTPAALAAEAEAVITILTDEPAIEAVYDGPEGLLSR